MNAPPNAPENCPTCNAPLTSAQWSIAYGTSGPQPFTQCPSCYTLLHLPAPPPQPPSAA